MLYSIKEFSRVLFFLGLIWFVVIAAMVYFGDYIADRRAFKENPNQFRGWNNKDR